MKNERIIKNISKVYAWWNWDENIIKQRIGDFHKTIESFVEKYYNE